MTVEAALAAVLDDVHALVDVDIVDVFDAAGRVLAMPLQAMTTQPPFDASAMDGYAVRSGDVATLPATLRVIGEAAAGHAYDGSISAGDAVRIFTGAPMPRGADAIVIQEHARRDGHRLTVVEGQPDAEHVRPRGGDFSIGDLLLTGHRKLGPRDVTLAAAMGHGRVPVRRKPRVAILATGDELVLPGNTPGPSQIVCSNPVGVAALVAASGGSPIFLGIAQDTRDSLRAHLEAACEADIVVTLGGASVGDHDLVGPVLRDMGLDLGFWKIAMRPGKPLMFGRLGTRRVLGLPGNPVSSLVTARLFLVPLVRALLGLEAEPHRAITARCTVALPPNGPRAHYMRAVTSTDADGVVHVTPVRSQDSSLLSPLAEANVLLIRSIRAPATPAGTAVAVLPLDM